MNVMMELRKCCNHPYLLRGVEERICQDLSIEDKNDIGVLHSKMIESSGKLSLLDKLLPKLFAQGHKVLIFSQMVKVLNIIEDFIRYIDANMDLFVYMYMYVCMPVYICLCKNAIIHTLIPNHHLL
jgi:SNF2 family DNA or RNA helicase